MLFLREFWQRRRQFYLSILSNFLAILLLLTVSDLSALLLQGIESRLAGMSLDVSCLQYLKEADYEDCENRLIENCKVSLYSRYCLYHGEEHDLAYCRDLSRLFDLEFLLGRFFSEQQVINNENVAVLGHEVWLDLGCPAVNESFSLNGAQFMVCGVLKQGYENIWLSGDDIIFLPLGYLDEADEVRLFFRSDGGYLDDLLDETLGEDGYLLIRQAMLKKSFSQLLKQGQAILLALSLFCLLISLLGMVNHTLSSLKGRYREIGIKKALGAEEGDIIRQFLLEALLIMLISSLSALLTETAVMKAASLMSSSQLTADRRYSFLLWVIPAGCLCCLYPAYRAGKVSIMEAIRN
ncbi:MAG: ABC transporter permease [Erysipelotrichaceae bacterium]|nr:ABC transporter permease [Erysipelotrichaceae bacterium]